MRTKANERQKRRAFGGKAATCEAATKTRTDGEARVGPVATAVPFPRCRRDEFYVTFGRKKGARDEGPKDHRKSGKARMRWMRRGGGGCRNRNAKCNYRRCKTNFRISAAANARRRVRLGYIVEGVSTRGSPFPHLPAAPF